MKSPVFVPISSLVSIATHYEFAIDATTVAYPATRPFDSTPQILTSSAWSSALWRAGASAEGVDPVGVALPHDADAGPLGQRLDELAAETQNRCFVGGRVTCHQRAAILGKAIEQIPKHGAEERRFLLDQLWVCLPERLEILAWGELGRLPPAILHRGSESRLHGHPASHTLTGPGEHAGQRLGGALRARRDQKVITTT